MNYTKGKWYVKDYREGEAKSIRCDCGEGLDAQIAFVLEKGDAHIIAAAVNACIKVNPNNPLAVAESIQEMYEAMKELIKVYNIEADAADSDYHPSCWRQAYEALVKVEGKKW